jgi:hypothetical protein
MLESAGVALAAASLTAEEVAECYRRGVPFTDLVILTHPIGEAFGRTTMNVRAALNGGAFIVWLLDQECDAITVYQSWSHLQVARADDELAMPELPYFRCRVRDFYRLLGFPTPLPVS